MKAKTFFKGIVGLFLIIFAFNKVEGQTCTISSSANWDNSSSPACDEGGNANDPGISIINIPSGVTLTFDNNGDTWTGTRIDVFGTLSIKAPGQVTIESNITVKNGGLLSIESKLNIGGDPDCGFTLIIENGGLVDIVGSSTQDRLNICNKEIARGGTAGCNSYPDGPLPYCQPTGGFTGPAALDEGGVNSSLLPVELVFFNAKPVDTEVQLSWRTATELNNDFFTLERSQDGKYYSAIGTVQGYGTTNQPQDYGFMDHQPLSGLSYYRLKQTDFDGAFEIFRPVSVYVDGDEGDILLFPNPVVNDELFILASRYNANVRFTVEIADLTGKNVLSSILNVNGSGALNDKINLAGLPNGTYLVKLLSGSNHRIFKIIKD